MPAAEAAPGHEVPAAAQLAAASEASEDSIPASEPAPALEAAPPMLDEPTDEASTHDELDSNSDNEPTHVLDGAILRARLAQIPSVHDEPSHDEPSHDEPSHDVSSYDVSSHDVSSHDVSSHDVSRASSDDESELAAAAPPQDEFETRPLAVEQALALEHALDAERAPDPETPELARVRRDFGSSGSEMPVVLSSPPPPRAEGPTAALLEAGRTWLPEVKAWSKTKLRATPRTLVISAPFVALFGIWAAHRIATRSHHDAPVANAAVEVALANPPPAIAPQESAVPASAPLPTTAAAPHPAPPPAVSVDPAELQAAKTHGLPALEALAAKYPGDLQVGIALASQQAHAQRFEAAVTTVDQLLANSPSSAQNGKVMGILWRAAQSPASEQTFVSLRKLGALGSDVAFDLAATAGVRDAVRERARAELADHMAEGASADTRVAAALLLAPDCSTRKTLLERAGREGGKRTRGLLEGYTRGAACTSGSGGSCNACLAGSAELSLAQAKLNEGAKP